MGMVQSHLFHKPLSEWGGGEYGADRVEIVVSTFIYVPWEVREAATPEERVRLADSKSWILVMRTAVAAASDVREAIAELLLPLEPERVVDVMAKMDNADGSECKLVRLIPSIRGVARAMEWMEKGAAA